MKTRLSTAVAALVVGLLLGSLFGRTPAPANAQGDSAVVREMSRQTEALRGITRELQNIRYEMSRRR